MLLLLLALACTVPAPDLARPTTADPTPSDPASPPPARGPEEEKLYQALYAGETGEAAHARGQRTRLLAWMVALELTPHQLRGLAKAAEAVHAGETAVREARDALGAKELAAYEPIYAELDARLATGDPLTEAEGAAFAERLAAARAAVYADGDPRAAHYARVQGLLAQVRPWVAALSDEQRERLGESRFVLARRLGPLVNPGDYGDLVGTMWDGGDFGSLRATVRPTDQGHLDLGGLWSVEKMQAGPDRRLEHFQLEALVLMTLLEPELPAAIALRLGDAPTGAAEAVATPATAPAAAAPASGPRSPPR
ncbi:MAG: hypothetical protein ACK4YP_11775 [Myxococcota bacterium]